MPTKRAAAPAPDADAIMALALAYAHEHGNWRFMGHLMELDEWPKGGSTYRREHEEARAALRAAVEQLVTALAQSDAYLNAAMECAERAEQEAAELRKDAERYRWLRDNAHNVKLYLYDDPKDPMSGDWAKVSEDNIDHEIDAAMGEKK